MEPSSEVVRRVCIASMTTIKLVMMYSRMHSTSISDEQPAPASADLSTDEDADVEVVDGDDDQEGQDEQDPDANDEENGGADADEDAEVEDEDADSEIAEIVGDGGEVVASEDEDVKADVLVRLAYGLDILMALIHRLECL